MNHFLVIVMEKANPSLALVCHNFTLSHGVWDAPLWVFSESLAWALYGNVLTVDHHTHTSCITAE